MKDNILHAPDLPDEDTWKKRKFSWLETGYVYAPYVPLLRTPEPPKINPVLAQKFTVGYAVGSLRNHWYVNASLTT